MRAVRELLERPQNIRRPRDSGLLRIDAGGAELFEGVHDVLAMLRERFRLAIITNGLSDLQRQKVKHFDLDRVDWIVVSGERGRVGIRAPARIPMLG
jgi:FMN phosphatase YigB (HAD superfamily)